MEREAVLHSYQKPHRGQGLFLVLALRGSGSDPHHPNAHSAGSRVPAWLPGDLLTTEWDTDGQGSR